MAGRRERLEVGASGRPAVAQIHIVDARPRERAGKVGG